MFNQTEPPLTQVAIHLLNIYNPDNNKENEKIIPNCETNIKMIEQMNIAESDKLVKKLPENVTPREWIVWAEKEDYEIPSQLSGLRAPIEVKAHPGVIATKGSSQEDDINKSNNIIGKIPRVAIGILAVQVAWKIERLTKVRATVEEVMTQLQELADAGEYSDILREADRKNKCVIWITSKANSKKYDVDACSKTLEIWNKSSA